MKGSDKPFGLFSQFSVPQQAAIRMWSVEAHEAHPSDPKAAWMKIRDLIQKDPLTMGLRDENNHAQHLCGQNFCKWCLDNVTRGAEGWTRATLAPGAGSIAPAPAAAGDNAPAGPDAAGTTTTTVSVRGADGGAPLVPVVVEVHVAQPSAPSGASNSADDQSAAGDEERGEPAAKPVIDTAAEIAEAIAACDKSDNVDAFVNSVTARLRNKGVTGKNAEIKALILAHPALLAKGEPWSVWFTGTAPAAPTSPAPSGDQPEGVQPNGGPGNPGALDAAALAAQLTLGGRLPETNGDLVRENAEAELEGRALDAYQSLTPAQRMRVCAGLCQIGWDGSGEAPVGNLITWLAAQDPAVKADADIVKIWFDNQDEIFSGIYNDIPSWMRARLLRTLHQNRKATAEQVAELLRRENVTGSMLVDPRSNSTQWAHGPLPLEMIGRSMLMVDQLLEDWEAHPPVLPEGVPAQSRKYWDEMEALFGGLSEIQRAELVSVLSRETNKRLRDAIGNYAEEQKALLDTVMARIGALPSKPSMTPELVLYIASHSGRIQDLLDARRAVEQTQRPQRPASASTRSTLPIAGGPLPLAPNTGPSAAGAAGAQPGAPKQDASDATSSVRSDAPVQPEGPKPADTPPAKPKRRLRPAHRDWKGGEGQTLRYTGKLRLLLGRVHLSRRGLQRKLEESAAKLASAQGLMETAEADVARLEGELSTERGNTQQLQSELGQARVALETAQRELAAARENERSLRTQLDEANRRQPAVAAPLMGAGRQEHDVTVHDGNRRGMSIGGVVGWAVAGLLALTTIIFILLYNTESGRVGSRDREVAELRSKVTTLETAAASRPSTPATTTAGVSDAEAKLAKVEAALNALLLAFRETPLAGSPDVNMATLTSLVRTLDNQRTDALRQVGELRLQVANNANAAQQVTVLTAQLNALQTRVNGLARYMRYTDSPAITECANALTVEDLATLRQIPLGTAAGHAQFGQTLGDILARHGKNQAWRTEQAQRANIELNTFNLQLNRVVLSKVWLD